jgi:hypothetical protein
MITPKSFVNGVTLTDAVVTYYTTPAGTKALVKRATFCNDYAFVVTITINLVASGGSATYANRITKTRSLAAGETWSCPDVENHVLETGGFISMVASVTGVVGVRVSGFEII